jgi:hypothetical protein
MRIWQLTVVVAAVAISLVSCASLEDKKWYQEEGQLGQGSSRSG